MVGVLVHALVSASLQAPPPPLVLVFALACEPLAGGASDGVALVQSFVQVLAGTCVAKHYHATLEAAVAGQPRQASPKRAVWS
jgi:hypothetical protein